jgi:hypothetical protein
VPLTSPLHSTPWDRLIQNVLIFLQVTFYQNPGPASRYEARGDGEKRVIIKHPLLARHCQDQVVCMFLSYCDCVFISVFLTDLRLF